MSHELPTLVAPIIFVGMHRSGTSMLTRFLRESGLETGWSLTHDESVFFHKLNLYVERVCNCGWDNPWPIEHLTNCTTIESHVLDHLRRSLDWPKNALYFGWPRFLSNHSFQRLNNPWGWKDPRNTFTAGLWKKIFPKARFLHIYRNGVDVAASLRERELNKPPRPESVYSSPRCCTLEGGFELWETYMEKAFAIEQDHPPENVLHLRYEDFLLDPIPFLENMADFCGLQPSESELKRVAAKADVNRAYAFRNSDELRDYYRKVQSSTWMKRLGYAEPM